jgi:hypothetical protein
MRSLFILTALLATFAIGFSQDDDCDPNSNTGNSWLESKRKEYGPNCMQYVMNRIGSTDFATAITVKMGNGSVSEVPTIDPFKKVSGSAPRGTWASTIRQTYRSMNTYHDPTDVPVYARPVFIEHYGNRLVVTSYTTPIDTTFVEYNDEAIKKYVSDEADVPKGIEISLTKHVEEGKVYYKASGVISPSTKPIEPSNLAEMIVKFCNSWMFNLIHKVNDIEIEHIHGLKKKKNASYKKEELERLYNVSRFSGQGGGKEGTWSWNQSSGKKTCLVENDGNEIRIYIEMKAEVRKLDQILEKMKEWVKKNPFDEAKATEAIKNYAGNRYWVKAVIDPSKFTGEDLLEDVFQEFFDDYTNDVLDKIIDIADDIK